MASLQYQLNETIYETRTQEGTIARNIIRTPSSDTAVETVRTDAEGLIMLRKEPQYYSNIRIHLLFVQIQVKVLPVYKNLRSQGTGPDRGYK